MLHSYIFLIHVKQIFIISKRLHVFDESGGEHVSRACPNTTQPKWLKSGPIASFDPVHKYSVTTRQRTDVGYLTLTGGVQQNT